MWLLAPCGASRASGQLEGHLGAVIVRSSVSEIAFRVRRLALRESRLRRRARAACSSALGLWHRSGRFP